MNPKWGRPLKHGATSAGRRDSSWIAWQSMRRYGAPVCPKWDDYTSWLMDLGPRPDTRWILERPDRDRQWEPGNCRWAPRGEVMRRRLAGRINNSLRQRIADRGMPYSVGYQRMRAGWSFERAVTTPIQVYAPRRGASSGG